MSDPTCKDRLQVAPPPEIELPEMIQAAAEIDDPMVYKIIDIQIARRRAALRGQSVASHAQTDRQSVPSNVQVPSDHAPSVAGDDGAA